MAEVEGRNPAAFPVASELGTRDAAAVGVFGESADVAPARSVSVVVRTRCNPGRLERCLSSILGCDYDDFEAIVVESRPRSPDTARMLVERFPRERRLRYVEETRNSASLARNAGLARAEGEIIAFIDEDVVVDAGWLRASVTALLSDQDIACVTGLILPLEPEGRSQFQFDDAAGLGTALQRRIYRYCDVSEANPLLPFAAGALGPGGSIVMLTEVARALGGFDPALSPARPTIGGEDLDLLVRLLRSGHAVSYEPRAIVWCDDTTRPRRLRTQVYRHGVRLGAVVGKHVIADPQRPDFLRAVPAGRPRLHDPGSRGDVAAPTGYPRDLTLVARLGMLVGAIAYVASALIVAARRLAVIEAPGPRPLRLVRRMVVRGEPINSVSFGNAEAAGVRFAWRRAAQPAPNVLGWARARARAQSYPIGRALVLAAPLAAVALWIASLPQIDPRAMTDLGLISVLPYTFVLAVAILTVSFMVRLHSRTLRTWPLAAHVLALVMFIHGTPTIVYGTLRYSWAWKHVGIVDYLARHGTVDPGIRFQAVYHNWPGFFGLDTLLTEVAGLPDTLALATWGPVFNNVMFLGALLFLFSGLTRDRRVVWLACWLFFIANWVGQDYFSPQAFAFVLYLLLLGVVVRWLGPRTRGEHPGRVASVGLAVLALAAIAPTHALTSVMAFIALTALVLMRVCDARPLPVVAVALTGFWDLVFARDFAGNNIGATLGEVNLPWDTTTASLTNVGRLSPDQALVANVARGLSLIVVVIAVAGALRQLRAGKVNRAAVVLAVAPVALFATGSYDGEILFRIYMFAAPFLAFLGAHAFIGPRRRRISLLATALVTTVLLGVFLVAYYGKDRLNYFTPQEVAAARYVDTHAPPDSLLVDVTNNYPFSFKNYERFVYVSIAREPPASRARVLAAPAAVLSNWLDNPSYHGAYLIITRSQKIEVEADGVMPAGSVAVIERALLASPRLRVVFHNRDAMVFSRVGTPAGGVTR